MSEVWFVTGASRGLGAEVVREALARGHQVVATARRPEAIPFDGVLKVALDVADEAQATRAVDQAMAAYGRVDVLVNNAGRGLLGAVEEATDEAARAVFDINVFGLLNVQRAVLPVMRAQQSGHVVQLSSVGGFTGAPGWGVYAATKFAVEGLSEALAAEVGPLGIKVTIVEPGFFRTDFLDGSSLHTADARIDDYAATAGRVRELMAARNHAQPGDPVKAARAIVDLTKLPEPPLRIQLGRDAVERIGAKLDFMRSEQEKWRTVSMSTDREDA